MNYFWFWYAFLLKKGDSRSIFMSFTGVRKFILNNSFLQLFQKPVTDVIINNVLKICRNEDCWFDKEQFRLQTCNMTKFDDVSILWNRAFIEEHLELQQFHDVIMTSWWRHLQVTGPCIVFIFHERI